MIAESNERISDSFDGMYVTVTAYLTEKNAEMEQDIYQITQINGRGEIKYLSGGDLLLECI